MTEAISERRRESMVGCWERDQRRLERREAVVSRPARRMLRSSERMVGRSWVVRRRDVRKLGRGWSWASVVGGSLVLGEVASLLLLDEEARCDVMMASVKSWGELALEFRGVLL